MTTTTTTPVTYFEVIFGADEADRQTYTDYGDGSFISRTAEARATSVFLDLAAKGVRCGFYTNGVLVAGEDVCADELTDADFPEQPEPIQHKTRCYTEEVGVAESGRTTDWYGARADRWTHNYVALCRCGWSSNADDITSARAAARYHRARFAPLAVAA